MSRVPKHPHHNPDERSGPNKWVAYGLIFGVMGSIALLIGILWLLQG